MKTFHRRSMRWMVGTLALMTLSLALVTPKGTGFLVSAQAEETEGEGEETLKAELESAGEAVKQAAVEGLRIVEDEESSGDDEDEPMPGAKVEILTDENFERLTQVSTGATTGDWFVEFYAPWCGHCRKLEAPWNSLAEQLGGKVNVGKVDVTQNKALGKRFGIKSFPTLLMFSHGRVHKFAQSRSLETLLGYAKGGFKQTESLSVPPPPSLAGGVKGILTGVLKDVEGIKQGKMPKPITIAAITAALMLLLLIFAASSPTKPPVASRRKQD